MFYATNKLGTSLKLFTLIITYRLNRLFFILIIIFSFIKCSSIKEKPLLLYDTENNLVSQDEFYKKMDFRYNIDVYYETDTSRVGALVIRSKFGKFDSINFGEIKKLLSLSFDTIIDFNKPVVINYYLDLKDNVDCAHEFYFESTTEELINFYSQFNILHVVDKYYSHNLKFNKIKVDKLDLIRSTFIKYRIRCLNYIAIKPNGSYYYCIGDGCSIYNTLLEDWPDLK